jgi:hypothetical protein
MNVCEQYGPSIHNVAEKYKEYAPENLEWTDDFMDADICIDHLIGTPDRENLVNPLERSYSEEVKLRLELAKDGFMKVAYVMHCAIVADKFYHDALWASIASTGFLDLREIFGRVLLPEEEFWIRVAWGVEPADFLLPTREKDPEYLIYTWGASADPEEEYIKTIYEAVKKAKGKMLHSGYDYRFDNGEHYVYVPPALTKAEVAQRYNKCYFANAMRKEDGFELANIEAPLANAWPITLQKPCYMHFFRDTSYKLSDERDDIDMVEQLYQVFSDPPYNQPTPEEKRAIMERFNWRDTVTPFWERVCQAMSCS